MSVRHLIRIARSMPLHVAAGKAGRRLLHLARNRLLAQMLKRQCTFPGADQVAGPLARRIAPLAPHLLNAARMRDLAARTLSHRFDLLGSGWVTVERGRDYAGFGPWRYATARKLPADWRAAIAAEGWSGNRMAAAQLLAMIDDPHYRPIDWHVDFKSGFRWSVRNWGASTPYGHRPGVDVKVPWELARLHHLAWLAQAYALDGDARFAGEFRNQVLDFLASNPPGWGVNWACAMDVAIRAANILLAFDLLRAHGARFDAAFEGELAAAMLAHGRHLVAHLEWHDQHRANHYLADICGLAWIAAYLPRSGETDLWLAFATQQLAAEIERQFGPDGANFEASTAYHRLSAEMAIATTALILGLPEDKRRALTGYDSKAWRRQPALAPAPMAWPPIGDGALDRLARAGRFAHDVTKPSGTMVQIGDNDSGRFFMLDPGPDLDVSHLVAAAKGLFALDLPGPETADTAVIASLAGNRLPARPLPATALAQGDAAETAASRVVRVVIPAGDALAGLDTVAYPDFGLFLWKNARAFIAVRCGPIGQGGNGAHAHNDQLAVEIEIDGIAWARDPGSFVYTPDLAARNAYRSALAHFVPRHGQDEPARMLAPFRLEDRAKARAIRFHGDEFLGMHGGFGTPVWRRVLVGGGAIVVEDGTGGSAIGPATQLTEHRPSSPAELAALWGLTVEFSPGYGRKQ